MKHATAPAHHTAIEESTKRARKLDLDVKWLVEFPNFTLLIGNPMGTDAWAHLEIVLPFTESGHRPILRIERSHNQPVFDRLTKMYDALWDQAEPPPAIAHIYPSGL
ncbi:MAG: hypothetical protein O6944_07930 [Gammaproteobacteria bacterium]|nr:hypothetical protein [Gammaproteobacteria bacterium]